MPGDKVTKRLLISGRVQGVGYRMSLLYAAQRYGVTGWVRNRRDGMVEAVVQGDPSAVENMVEWSRKGPDLAEVENVEVLEASGDFSEFGIADTL